MKGYVLLPRFTVEVVNEDEVKLTCGSFLEWVFENFLAFLWNGEVHITDERKL